MYPSAGGNAANEMSSDEEDYDGAVNEDHYALLVKVFNYYKHCFVQEYVFC